MNAFEINKIVGALLGTVLLVMGVGFLAEAIYAPIKDRGPGYSLPGGAEADSHEEVEVVETVPLGVLLASASAEDGAKVSRKCQSCHNFGEGDSNKIGPALYGVVGRGIATHEGFAFSDVLSGFASEGKIWTYESLNEFLTKPKDFAPGTKMSFAGLSKEQDRMNMLAYLQSLSADPVAFPSADEAAPAAEEMSGNSQEATQETAPAATEEAAPVSEEATSATEEATTTMAEETVPVAEEATQAVEEAAPETTQESEQQESEQQEAAPVTQEAAPATQETTTTQEATPTTDEAAPAAQEAVPVAEEPASAGVEESPLLALVAAGDADKGARVARKCQACHGLNEGDTPKVGPPLFGVVGRPVADYQGYKYSDTLVQMGSEGQIWSLENLNEFLTKPRDFAPGTKMGFPGLRKEADRINILAYFSAQSSDGATAQ